MSTGLYWISPEGDGISSSGTQGQQGGFPKLHVWAHPGVETTTNKSIKAMTPSSPETRTKSIEVMQNIGDHPCCLCS